MHEDDGQRDTTKTKEKVLEQTAAQTTVEHSKLCV